MILKRYNYRFFSMKIPEYILEILNQIEKNNFEAFIVGGCVRDLIMNNPKSTGPKDWDITTNAKPEQIIKIFPDGKYENNFGTVLVPIKDGGEVLDVVEITTYRSEQGYSDRRHPDEVKFEDSLDLDLERRDFTINAMAAKVESQKEINNYKITDLFGGEKDIKKKIIRAVGEPTDRFKEDALRMLRAVRFSSQLDFSIEPKTERAITKLAGSIKFVSNERIRDELVKILNSNLAYEGIIKLHELKLLQYILPELERGIGVDQNHHHTYTVFKHSVLSLKYCPSHDWRVRFASLLHDIGKPQTKRIVDGDATFYNHEMLSAKIATKIMQRLKFSIVDIEKISTLIRHHMFYYNVDEVTESSVRRLMSKVGEENLHDLIDLRIADRLGSGVAKAKPYKLRHLEYMFEKVRHDPVSVKMLKINGDILMNILKIEPSPKIGAILDVLLSEVIDNPLRNTPEYLENRSYELNKLNLEELRHEAKEKIQEKKSEDDKALKNDFYVK